MALFGRRKPLHRRLAEEGDLVLDGDVLPRGGPADPPGWHGEQRGEPGIHGVPRARRWDAVVAADAPDLESVERRFVALPDGSTVGADGVRDEALAPLAAALAGVVQPPYRAEAVPRGRGRWAVAAARIRVEEVADVDGDELELVRRDGVRTLHVDGRPVFGSAPAFERMGEGEAGDYVVRARRIAGDLWEVETSAL